MTLWNLNSFSSHIRWCGPLHLPFLGNLAFACTNIQQVAQEEEVEELEEEGDTAHIDTWHNVRMWVDLFDGLH